MDLQYEEISVAEWKRNERNKRKKGCKRQLQCRGGYEEGRKLKEKEKIGMKKEKVEKEGSDGRKTPKKRRTGREEECGKVSDCRMN